MVQKARPVADVSNDGWAPTPVYAQVDEATPDDGTFVAAPALPAASFVVRLGPVAQPGTGPGRPDPALTVRAKGPGTVLVELLQGANLVAARTYDTTGAFAAYTMTLTAAEAATILWPQGGPDPDLRVRVTAYASSSSSGSSSGSGVSVLCCPDSLVPAALPVAFSGGTGDLTCLNGLTINVAWNGSNWINNATGITCACGSDWFSTFAVGCLNTGGGSSRWSAGFNGFDSPSYPACVSCDPFGLVFYMSLNNGLCSGTVKVAIGTEPTWCCNSIGCGDAIAMTVGVPQNVGLCAGQTKWYKVPVANGSTYAISLSGESANFGLSAYYGTSCEGLGIGGAIDHTACYPIVFSCTGSCLQWTSTIDGYIYLEVSSSTIGQGTIAVDSGACP